MIFISPSVVLTQSADDANAPVIGWHNIATSVAASTAAANHPVINLTNPATHLRWQGTNTGGSETLTITVPGSPGLLDYIAFAGHNLGSRAVPVTITGQLGGTQTLFTGVLLPGDDRPVIFRFTPGAYTSFSITLGAAAGNMRIAALYCGKLLVMPRKIYVGHTPINFGRMTNVVTGMSNNGNFLGRVVLQEKRTSQIAFQNIPPAFYRASVEPFVVHSLTKPFFFAWRPLTYPQEVGYCWATGDIRPSNQLSNGFMEFSLDVEGIAR